MSRPEVFNSVYAFLEEEKRISLTPEQFTLMLSSFEEELAQRLNEPNKIRFTIEAPLSEEEEAYFQYYMEDYDWKVRFEGAFPPDYRVPMFFLQHAV